MVDGTATLNNVDADTDPFNNCSGLYLQNSNLDGKTLGTVNKLSLSYTGVSTAGGPRISLPIDTDGGGTDFYAFISTFYCNDGAGHLNSLTDSTCTIFAGNESFATWAALLAAHPTWRVGGNLPFIIADDPGSWTVSDVQLGKDPAK